MRKTLSEIVKMNFVQGELSLRAAIEAGHK
jgi:hypothetical protein